MLLRIATGSWRGRTYSSISSPNLRPTSSRLREVIAEKILGSLGKTQRDVAPLRVMDLCAGAGTLGFEALSWGASSVLFVESHRRTGKVLSDNIEKFAATDRAKVWVKDVLKLPRRPANYCQVDLVFFDPPYASTFIDDVFARLRSGDWLASDARLVLETSAKMPQSFSNEDLCFKYQLSLDFERDYGGSRLSIFCSD